MELLFALSLWRVSRKSETKLCHFTKHDLLWPPWLGWGWRLYIVQYTTHETEVVLVFSLAKRYPGPPDGKLPSPLFGLNGARVGCDFEIHAKWWSSRYFEYYQTLWNIECSNVRFVCKCLIIFKCLQIPSTVLKQLKCPQLTCLQCLEMSSDCLQKS